MPRILPAASGAATGNPVPYSSTGGRLIFSEYSDAEGADRSIPHQDVFREAVPGIRWRTIPDPEKADRGISSPEVPLRPRSCFPGRMPGSFLNDFRTVVERNMRLKPAFADCWLVGNAGELESIAEYDTPNGKVVIGVSPDGETEYNLTPNEYTYPDSLNAVVCRAIDGVRKSYRENGGRMDRQSILGTARGMIMDSSDTVEAVYGNDTLRLESAIGELSDTVYRYTVGLGVFDVLLADPKLEDIYIDAPCDRNRIHVTMNGIMGLNSNLRCRTNLIVEKKEVMNLINVLKRDSGLPYCESNPILETDMGYHDARATVVGHPMSPNGDAVSIRKHSVRPWTLTRLIANGTVDPKTAGLLSFLVANRATFLICGARGAGKSSLLSSLLFEFPVSQRILTIEDTMELPGDRMRRMGYKVQSMLIDDRMDGSNLSRADEALRVSLRMGESAIILGEVRGEEAKTLYQSMRTGRAGSSIMGTMHGDSAKSVYERVVHDMGIAPEAFMATDILVTLGTVRDRRTGNQIRRLNEIVATGERAGDFTDISDPDALFSSPVMRRVTASSQLDRAGIAKEIRARSLIKAYLADAGNRFGEEYLGPEWIVMSNDHVSKSDGKTADDIFGSFKTKFRRATGVGE